MNQKVRSKKMMSDDERINASKTPKGIGITAIDPAGASAGEARTTPKAINKARLKRLAQLAFRSGYKSSAKSAIPSTNSAIAKKPRSKNAETIGNRLF
ncbi:hypothetical protein [Rhodanobacter terrae]|uniref:Uncharacterized protein n=1 Tax=Rhodanobacter terrae TaxID=418647 RepID=A0ABW0T2K0_9GAMM